MTTATRHVEQAGRGADIVVVGAGVIGLSCAWRLAAGGAQVSIVDPRPGRGSSFAAAGMLAPVTEVHFGEEALLSLTLRAADAWPDFAQRLRTASDLDPGYRDEGTLLVGLDAGDKAVLEQLFEFQRGLSLPVTWLGPTECRTLEPLLAPGVRGGILAGQDRQIDNRRLLACLAEACRRAGVVTVEERVLAVSHAAGAVDGVETTAGRLGAPVVVLAAGYETGAIGGLTADDLPPVRPVKGEILRLRVREGAAGGFALGHTVRGVVQGTTVYVVPRADGGIVLGATMQEVGPDTAVEAGSVYRLLRDAIRLLPGIADVELLESLAGLRPGSPDNAPVVGAKGPSGLVFATGHHRNGVLLAPVTAEAVAVLLETGHLPDWARPMDPARFAATAAR